MAHPLQDSGAWMLDPDVVHANHGSFGGITRATWDAVTVARAISVGAKGTMVERQTKTGSVAPVAIDAGTITELRAHQRRQKELPLACGAPWDPGGPPIPFVAAFLIAVHFWRVRKDGGISGPV